MKKLMFLFSLLFLMTCQNDDDNNNNNNCNFLLSVGINRTISLSLPQYSELAFATSSVYIANEGNAGIYVVNVGGNYRAFDAGDPNHAPESCSFLSKSGTIVTCGCQDAYSYNLLTGTSNGEALPCGLLEYRVSASGSELTITN